MVGEASRAAGSAAPSSLRPEPTESDDNAALRTQNDPTKRDDMTTRKGKLKIRIQVGELKKILEKLEKELTSLKRKRKYFSIGEQRCLKRTPKSILNSEPDEKDIVPEKDVGFIPHKSLSKLPVLDKSKFDELPKITTDVLTKVVGLETLYGVLMEEHLGLQMSLQETVRRLRGEERRCRELEEQREGSNPINCVLAERLASLQSEAESLRRTVAELREENDHLEFRLLEMDEIPIRKTVYRSSSSGEGTKFEPSDLDDVSDSGVMSLPTSDDEHPDFASECKSEGDVKSRLQWLSQSCSVPDRICLQQGLALLRHYEARIESLEATIAAMCHGATLSRGDELRGGGGCGGGGGGRIIATVLPFTEPRKDSATLAESGIFDDEEDLMAFGGGGPWPSSPTAGGGGGGERYSRACQTEPLLLGGRLLPPPDLSTELEKLTRIREKMETVGLQHQQTQPSVHEPPPGKELAYYRSRVETLESRLEVYEARPEETSRLLKARLEKEARLEAELTRLRERLGKLEAENRVLEEEKCELEEAENDTRLRCQKLEFKLSALGEKKHCLQTQLEQLTHEMAAREEELRQKSRMEAIVQNYEKKNQELEEREMELRYRLQMMEGTMPALMMWQMWRMTMTMMGQNPGGVQTGPLPAVLGGPVSGSSNTHLGTKEEELVHQLTALQSRLATEARLLEESREAEDVLRNKIRDLESIVESKDSNILHILNRDPGQDIQAFEKLSKMAKERVEMDRRIKDLELKEKMYQETLQQVDGMFADLEGSYSQKLKEKEDQLSNSETKLAETELKLKQNSQLTEMNLQLQEKLSQLELEMKKLTEALKKRELEREALENEERRLNDELHECLGELDSLKKEIEGPMKGQLEVQRRRASALEEQLEKARDERLSMEAEHRDEVHLLERKINQLTKELLESDVTIGELREEVQTLETAIHDIKVLMSLEKADKEELKKVYEAEIEEKERQFEELRESLKTRPASRSLKEELEEVRIGGSQIPPAAVVVAAMTTGPTLQKSEQQSSPGKEEVIMGDFMKLDLPPPPPPYRKEEGEKCEEIKQATCMTALPRREQKVSDLLKAEACSAIGALLTDLERGEPPSLDLSAATPAGPLIQPESQADSKSLPQECQMTQRVVASSSGYDYNSTISTVTKTFLHAKSSSKPNFKLFEVPTEAQEEKDVRISNGNIVV